MIWGGGIRPKPTAGCEVTGRSSFAASDMQYAVLQQAICGWAKNIHALSWEVSEVGWTWYGTILGEFQGGLIFLTTGSGRMSLAVSNMRTAVCAATGNCG